MRLLYSGGTSCSLSVLKRLLLIADEIGFMDRPSVTFENWGTVGHASEIRGFDTSGFPVRFSAHSPPSGPASALYESYIEVDLRNPRFKAAFLEGLRHNRDFAAKFIQEAADYGPAKGAAIREALVGDPGLATANIEAPVDPAQMFEFATAEQRAQVLKVLLIEASIHVTNALVIAEATGLLPVADDPYSCQLLGLRTFDAPYLGERPRVAPALAIAVARAVIPDQALAALTIEDVLAYRRSARDAYEAWSVEIDRLAATIADFDPQRIEDELPRIIVTDVRPKLIEYRHEMRTVRDRMFAGLAKKVATWEVPSLSLAFLAGLSPAAAIALFASALAPAVPEIVDYFSARREAQRRNSMAYLIGLAEDID